MNIQKCRRAHGPWAMGRDPGGIFGYFPLPFWDVYVYVCVFMCIFRYLCMYMYIYFYLCINMYILLYIFFFFFSCIFPQHLSCSNCSLAVAIKTKAPQSRRTSRAAVAEDLTRDVCLE